MTEQSMPNPVELYGEAVKNTRQIIANVRTDPDFEVESRQRFASAQGFYATETTQQFDMDDQRLIALSVLDIRDVVVQNFFEELKRLVPN